MFSEKLKEMVNEFCDDFIENSKLFELGRRNGITKYHLAAYLKNLEFLFGQNAQDLHRASLLYEGKTLISAFFKNKWIEERGHDAWARNDLKKIDASSAVCAEMRELTSFLTQTMQTAPHCYLCYLYFAEYMTIILGPIWMDLLHQNLDARKEDVTALTHHIDLDVDHYREVGEFVDQLNFSETEKSGVCDFYRELSIKYNAFFNSLAGEVHESVTSREVFNKLSAAT